MPPRRALYLPELTQVYEGIEADPYLAKVLVGHLWVEALLVQTLVAGGVSEDAAWSYNWPRKVFECSRRNIVTAGQATVLGDLNDLRNDFGHVLGQRLEPDRLRTFLERVDENFEGNDGLSVADAFDDDSPYDVPTAIHETLIRIGGSIVEQCAELYDVDFTGD